MEYIAESKARRAEPSRCWPSWRRCAPATRCSRKMPQLSRSSAKTTRRRANSTTCRTQLRDFITTNTGQAPQGNVARKTLVRMAMDAQPKEGGLT